jgi:amino acid adenylation domain-containing protein
MEIGDFKRGETRNMQKKDFSNKLSIDANQNLKEREYWFKKLSGNPVKSCFPYDFLTENPLQRIYKSKEIFLKGEAFSNLMKLSNGSDLRLHIILTTGVLCLLHKYNYENNHDILVGTPIYKQEQDREFINTILILRQQVNEGMTFKEMLLQVSQTIAEANEHVNYPIETLLYQLNIHFREDEDFPLFDTILLLENIHDIEYIKHLHTNTIFRFSREEDHISGRLEYNSLYYQEETIHQIISHLSQILEQPFRLLNQELKRITLITERDRIYLLETLNNTFCPYEKDMDIIRLFEEESKKTPGKKALQSEDVSLTFLALDSRTTQAAQYLKTKGVKEEDVISLLMDRSVEMIVGIVTILKANAAYLPLDPEYPLQRITYILKDSKTKYVLTQARYINNPDYETPILKIDMENEDSYPKESLITLENGSSKNLAYIIYTSGSTGHPKGVMVEHRNVHNLVLGLRERIYQYYQGILSISMVAPYVFDASVQQIFAALLLGHTLHIVPENTRVDGAHLIQYYNKYKIDISDGTPTHLNMMAESQNHKGKVFMRVRHFLIGGETLLKSTVKEFYRIFKESRPGIINVYGPAECCVDSTSYDIEKDQLEKLKEIPIGRPMPNEKIYILGRGGQLQPLGVPGEICIGGDGVSRGYLGDKSRNIEKFIINPYKPGEIIYRSGDLGKWTPEGNILFLGRIDFQVKVRGFRIELGEIENQLRKHESVKDAVVIARNENQENRQEKERDLYLIAFVVPDHGQSRQSTPDTNGLRDFLSGVLPRYMIPSYFVTLDILPMTPNGKTDRKYLENMELKTNNDSLYSAPRNDVDEKLVQIWSDVLKMDPQEIGIDHNFFEYGGHSLKATILISRIEKEFKVHVPIAEVFNTPNIRGLSDYLKDSLKINYSSIPAIEKKDYYIISSSQKRLYVLQQMRPDIISYNIQSIFLLEGKPDIELLEHTFRELIKRHESLRTSFEIAGHKPVQRVHDNVNFELFYFNIMPSFNKPSEKRISNTSGNPPLLAESGEQVKKLLHRFIKPFYLSKAPLVKVALVEVKEDQYILVVDRHHIISDGYSDEILMQDFISLYKRKDLETLRIQYKDFSEWQENPTGKSSIKKQIQRQEEYWLNEFKGEIPILSLPLDFSRPRIQSFQGNHINFEISKQDTDQLQTTGNQEEVTLFMVLLAIYNIYLYKITGQKDIITGTPIAGRRHADLHQVIGMFVNTLVLRNRIYAEMSFREYLNQIKRKTLQSFENQDYQFEDLVEHPGIEIQRDLSRNPIFDVMFVLQNMDMVPGDLQELEIETSEKVLKIKPYEYENKSSKFDMTLYAKESNGICYFTYEYCTALFKQTTIEGFIGYFKNLVRTINKDPNQEISRIEILPEKEKKKILETFNKTETQYPKEKTIPELLETTALKSPGRRAASGPEKGASVITYQCLMTRARYLSDLLVSKGITPFSIVSIMTEGSIKMIEGIMGIQMAAAAYLPIDPHYPMQRIEYLLQDSASRIILVQEKFSKLDKIKSLGESVIILDDYPYTNKDNKEPVSQAKRFFNPQSPSYVIYTSGTTGKPKGTIITHTSLVNRLHWMQKEYTLTEKDTLLHKTAFTFDVSVWEIFWWAIEGASVSLLAPGGGKNPQAIISSINREKVTLIHFVPSMLFAFLSYLSETEKSSILLLPSLRQIICSGEELKPFHVELFFQTLGKHHSTGIANLYGPTEATIDVTSYACKEIPKGNTPKAIPIGKPINNTKIYILDETKNPSPIGVIGELCITGTGLAKGYLNKPDLTMERFVDCPFETGEKMYRTGDLARWQPDGNIEFIGRRDLQVKIRGYRIELKEIENQLQAHPEVRETIVTYHTEPPSHHYLCGYVIFMNSTREPSARRTEIREYLSTVLPGYMVPTYIIPIKEIPLTTSGKPDRKSLPAPQIGYHQKNIAPGKPLEKEIILIWKEELKRKEISIRDNYFNIGGDSIKAIRLLSRINRELSVKLNMEDIYSHETVEKLAIKIEKGARIEKEEETRKVREKLNQVKEHIKKKSGKLFSQKIEDIYPMSDIEKGMIYYSLKNPDTAMYHDQFVFQMEYQDFDPGIFQKAMELMVDKHEILRTSFHVEGYEEPLQMVHKETKKIITHEDISSMEKQQQETYIKKKMQEDRSHAFDIREIPLWRLLIFTIGKDRICVVWTFHHAILDGWSNATLVTELNNIYMKLKTHPHYIPEKLASTYKDFIIEQIVEKGRKETAEYWKRTLDDYKRIEFPFKPSESRTSEIRRYQYPLPRTILAELTHYSQQHQVSMKDLYFAAYAYMINRMSYDNDIVVGMVTNNRPIIEDGEKILGCFLNTMPVRLKIPGGICWKEYTRYIKNRLTEIKGYEGLSFFEILRIIGEKTLEQNPVFDTIFNFVDFHVFQDAIRENPIQSDTRPPEALLNLEGYENTNTLLDFNIIMEEDEVIVSVSYSQQLIKDGELQQLCHTFNQILEKIIRKPEEISQKEAFIPEEEKEQLIQKLNETEHPFSSQERGIYTFFEEKEKKTPEKIAITAPSETWQTRGYEHHYSYRQLRQRVEQVSETLIKQGVRANTIVGILLERSIHMVEGILSVIRAGGTYLPLEPTYPQSRIQYMIKDSLAEILISELSLKETVDTLFNCHSIFIDQPTGEGKRQRNIARLSTENKKERATDTLYVIYTSGTTGKSKGVILQQGSVMNTLRTLQETYPLRENDRILLKTTYIFDVSVTELFGWILGGGSQVILKKNGEKDPEEILHALIQTKVTHLNFVPSMFRMFLDFLRQQQETPLPDLKYIFLAGEELSPKILEGYQQLFLNTQLENIYGPTEAAIYASSFSVGDRQKKDKIPIGIPLRNMKIYILDKNFMLLPYGVTGELTISGPGVSRGYLNRPDLTSEAFIESPFIDKEILYKTGDLARWLPEGQLEFLGRIDHQVKIRGYRIEPGEIENQLKSYEHLKDAVVINSTGKQDDKYLCAYVVYRRIVPGDYEKELRTYLSGLLPEYMVPRYIVPLEKIPLKPNGKIDRNALPAPVFLGKREGYQPPANEIEEKLVDIWAEILGTSKPDIGVETSFFELGGHSLKVTTLLARINKQFGKKVAMGTFFDGPRIRSLANHVSETENKTIAIIQNSEKKEYYELSSAQKRLYILNQLEEEEYSLSYNMPGYYTLEGELEVHQFERAFQKIIFRQQVLATSIIKVKGIPRQKILQDISFKIQYIKGRESENINRIKDFIRPFDLEKPPLLRVQLIHLMDKKHLLLFDMHHIISDGISMTLMLKELEEHYQGKGSAPLPIQYFDYSEGQLKYFDTEVFRKQEKYWMDQMEGFQFTQVPMESFRKETKITGEIKKWSIEREEFKKIETWCKQQQITRFIYMISIFMILLMQEIDQEDLTIGIPVSNREHNDLKNLMGLFLNVLLMRTKIEKKDTFEQYIQKQKHTISKSMENQDYPYEQVNNKIREKTSQKRDELFAIFFNYFTTQDKKENQENPFHITPYKVETYPKYPMTLSIVDDTETMMVNLSYIKEYYTEYRMDRMITQLKTISELVLEKPEIPIADMTIIETIQLDDFGTDLEGIEEAGGKGI